jgi:hypothetical protein
MILVFVCRASCKYRLVLHIVKVNRDKRTSAQLAALCILRMVPNRMIYMQQYNRLIKVQTSDNNATLLVTTSAIAASNWRRDKMALQVPIRHLSEYKKERVLTTLVTLI